MLTRWYRRLLARWELNGLLKDIQESIEYQDWLEQELANVKVQRLLMLKERERLAGRQ